MRGSLAVLLSAAAAGCAGTGGAPALRTPPPDPLYSMEMEEGGEVLPGYTLPAEGERLIYTVDLRFVGPEGRTVQAPRLTVFPSQRAHVSVLDRVAYVKSYETEYEDGAWIADPVIGTLLNGLVLEIVARPVAEAPGRVLLAYRAVTSESRGPFREGRMPLAPGAGEVAVQLPTIESSEVEAVRVLEAGVTGLLGVLPGPAGGRPFSVFARIVPGGVPDDGEEPRSFEAPALGTGEEDAAAETGILPHREPGGLLLSRIREGVVIPGPAGRLRVRALVLPRRHPVVTVLDRSATDAVLREGGSRTLRDLSLVTTLTPGVRVASHLDEAYVQDFEQESGTIHIRRPIIGTLRSGLSAVIEKEGTMTLTWTTSPEWEVYETTHDSAPPVRIDLPSCRTIRVAVPFTGGPRLVNLAHLPDGGTAALLLEFEPEVEPAPGSALRGAPSGTEVVRSR